jgi:hypothetical protein
MKIGFSLGRCVRDIVRGDVAIEDVAFIIAATNVHDPEQLVAVVEQYMYRDEYLYGLDEAECQQVALDLWKSNRLLQPRRQGMHRHMQPESSVWVDIFPTALSTNESVKSSWNAYRFMLQMIENVDNEAIEVFK